VFVELFIYRG